MPRDSQQSAVYAWENRVLPPLDPSSVKVERHIVQSKRPHPRLVLVTSPSFSMPRCMYKTDSRLQPLPDGWTVLPYFRRRHETDVQGGLSRDEAQAWADRVCQHYAIRPVRVAFQGKNRARFARAIRTVILPTWARTYRVLAHEVSHAIKEHWYGLARADHGGEFVAIFIDVLTRFMALDAAALHESAREAKLEDAWATVAAKMRPRG